MPGGRSASSTRRTGEKQIDLSIPLTGHLAKVYLEKVDMMGSIREVRRDERVRSKSKLKAVITQLGLQKQMKIEENPNVARALETDEEALQRKQLRLDELKRLLKAEEEESGGKPIGRSRSLVEIPDIDTGPDPETTRRIGNLDRQIYSREGAFQRCQSEAALRTKKMRAQTVFQPEKATEFLWDHLPQNALLSEKDAAFFPRSLKTLKEIGTGKDPRFVREMDENYKYREAMLLMENIKKAAAAKN